MSEKKRGTIVKRICVTTLCGVLFGGSSAAAFYGVNTYLNQGTGGSETVAYVSEEKSLSGILEEAKQETEDTTESKPSVTLSNISFSAGDGQSSLNLDVSDIAEGMMPAMVSITNVSVQEVQNYFGRFGRGQTQELKSSGTGIIIGQNEDELSAFSFRRIRAGLY